MKFHIVNRGKSFLNHWSSESLSISGSDWTRSFSSIFASDSELELVSNVLFLGFDDLTCFSLPLIRLRAKFSPSIWFERLFQLEMINAMCFNWLK